MTHKNLFKLYSIIFIILIFSFFTESKNIPLDHSVYDSWETIVSPQISNNGKWILYLRSPQKGDAQLIVQNVLSNRKYTHLIGYTGDETRAHFHAEPAFCYNSEFVFFVISQDMETVKDNDKNTSNTRSLGIMKLKDGSIENIKNIKSYHIPEKAGGIITCFIKEKENDKNENEKDEEEMSENNHRKEHKQDSNTLIIKDLQNEKEIKIPFVTSMLLDSTGQYVFFTVYCNEEKNEDGLFVYTDNKIRPILIEEGNYKHLTINKEETVLAFLSNKDQWKKKEPNFYLYGWKIGSEDPPQLWVSHNHTEDFPEGMIISKKAPLKLSDDGKVIQFGIIDKPDPSKEENEEKAIFELWHYNDPYPYPQQKQLADRIRDNAWESVYHIEEGKFIKLADEKLPELSIHSKGKIALGETNMPYSRKIAYFGPIYDIYYICTKSGKRHLVKEGLYGRSAGISPLGNFIIWFEDTDWFSYDIEQNKTVNLTKDLDISFLRKDIDIPGPGYSYGIGGWTDEDKYLLLYDRYDIWKISPDGSSRDLLTKGYGRDNEIILRYEKIDPQEISIDNKEDILLSAIHYPTMARGYYRGDISGKDSPERLILTDHKYSHLMKGKYDDKYLYTREAFHEFPDLWISDSNFRTFSKLTELGKQIEPYIWGRSELLHFYSSDGVPLRGILIKPDNYDPEKKYPLIVYIYEKLHFLFHNHWVPSPGININPSYYASNGYLIWLPNIVYNTGYPGQDAMKSVLPGIHHLIMKGMVDKDAMGIQGHSWGGYQIAYMITQTNIFSASVAGAPVSNMTSAYSGIRWRTGMSRQFQYEQGQSRIGASLWEAPQRYIENSPVFYADRIETPILIMHNDNDGAVPWYQGIEFFLALYRLNKEAYMFNYNNEGHGLRKRINQEDWTIRMADYFHHYLKGKPKPQWMSDGIKAWE